MVAHVQYEIPSHDTQADHADFMKFIFFIPQNFGSDQFSVGQPFLVKLTIGFPSFMNRFLCVFPLFLSNFFIPDFSFCINQTP
jgi:hypothetical protein